MIPIDYSCWGVLIEGTGIILSSRTDIVEISGDFEALPRVLLYVEDM
jgi:hypothetical protein